MQLHNLFPVPIAIVEMDRKLNDQELSFIYGLEKRPNMGNSASVNNMVLCDPALASLKVFCEQAVNQYFESTANPKNKVNISITQSWLNYSEHGQYHHKHLHHNSYISGVFFVQTNDDDRIYFYKDGWEPFKFLVKEWNLYNSESWWFEANAGKLIIFPSSLTHSVPEVQGSTTRISLGFDTFPVWGNSAGGLDGALCRN